MSIKEQVAEELKGLGDAELRQVAAYLHFLRRRSHHAPDAALDERKLATLYGECAEADRLLAEEGVSDYAAALLKEDNR
ncbi:MAG: hypothetical protein HY298_13265 [Verrucomicrobia bacterium]|nr:hypothetical protein [Verrucomicrobiota bacterium]